MSSNVQSDLSSHYEKIKLWYLVAAHSAIIAAYSIIRPIKSGVFNSFVGADYIPNAKMFVFVIAPLIAYLHTRIIANKARHQVATTYIVFYSIAMVLFALVFLHPTIGIPNTIPDSTRALGWIFYVCIDFFSVFVVGTFWAYINSISSPQFADNQYGIIVAGARAAGALSPLIALFTLKKLPDTSSIPISCVIATTCLIIAYWCIHQINEKVPEEHLEGYSGETKPEKTGILEGLRLMFAESYVFGAFVLVYAFEFICTFADFKMQSLAAAAANNSIGGITEFMLKYTSAFQVLGLIFALAGTKSLLKRIGVPACLMLSPIITLVMLVALIMYQNIYVATATMIVLRALNYGFNLPVREMLFIPTTHTIQFKSKAWVESFGKTISEGTSSVFNKLAVIMPRGLFGTIHPILSIGAASIWIVFAAHLGKRYQETISQGKVIGRKRTYLDL